MIEKNVVSGDWTGFGDLDALARDAVAATLHVAGLEAGENLELSLLFCDDAYMRKLNRDHRGVDKSTNVLSFPQTAGVAGALAGSMGGVLGDIVFAQETVTREAAADRKDARDHLAHLMVHGLLHLFGYDHGSDQDADVMEQLERRILHSLSIANPYDDAAGSGVDAA